MIKYSLAGILAASTVSFGLLAMPMAVFAQGGDSGKSSEMKGPPNADGAQKKDEMKQGDSGGSNGAAAAKATGEDKGK